MEYRSLGNSGLRVSVVGLGCNNFGRPGTHTETQSGTTQVVEAALEAGITLFDTADIYGYSFGRSESFLAETVRSHRDQMIVATKFGHQDYESPMPHWGAKASRRYIHLAVEASLRRLGTDWIDLYQLHTPDPHTPIEETLAALDELIQAGKIRYIGHSNFQAWQSVEAHYQAVLGEHPRFISAQNEYNLLNRAVEAELLPALDACGVGLLPYFPLANGLFTGKFSRESGPENSRIMRQRPHLWRDAPWDAIEAFEALCAQWGTDLLSATYGWLLHQPSLSSVISGASTPEQVRQNAVAGLAWQPSAQQYAQISALFPVR